MIKIDNTLEGKYAVPMDHPITCANPAPWKIIEMRIEQAWSKDNKQLVKVWIRGENSMWFNTSNCFISDKEDCDVFIEIRAQAEALNNATKHIPATRKDAQQMIELALRNNHVEDAIPIILKNLGYAKE